MSNSLFNFRDDEEREVFLVAIPVIALFAILGYWLMKGDVPEVATQSLPVIVADTDGDGVTDASDQCTGIAGDIANYGCPVNVAWADRDNDTDGIRNEIDSCPETKGTAENNGCAAVKAVAVKETVQPVLPIAPADTDGDGIIDDEDACIDVAGTDSNGCPADSDSDGIIDTEDQCPDEAGTALPQTRGVRQTSMAMVFTI